MNKQTAHLRISAVLPRPVLAGRLAGEADAPKLRAAVEAHARGGPAVVLDFDGVSALSSSYFASAFLPLWAGAWAGEAVPPLLANVSADVVDDVRLAVEANNAMLWTVEWKNGGIEKPDILGRLDKLDHQALEVAVREGKTDAMDLYGRNRSIGVTAWSTRLSALHQRGLLRRQKEGRRMTYTPPWSD